MLTRRRFHRHDAGRRRYACGRSTSGAAAARKQACYRRRTDASVESGIAGLAMGARHHAATAGADHHRAARADDGRSRRRPRRGRAAVVAGRPQRLCARGGEALSQPLPRHGPHSGCKIRNPRRCCRHGKSSPECSASACCSPAHSRPGCRTAPPTGSGRRPKRPNCRSCFSRPARCRNSARSRSAIRSSRSSSITWA